MNLKSYAGKHVTVQFKTGQGWYVVYAGKDGAAAPELVRGKAQDGSAVPVATPFVQGLVQEDGLILIATGQGGKIGVEICPEAIFSIAVVVEPATEPSIILQPNSPIASPS